MCQTKQTTSIHPLRIIIGPMVGKQKAKDSICSSFPSIKIEYCSINFTGGSDEEMPNDTTRLIAYGLFDCIIASAITTKIIVLSNS